MIEVEELTRTYGEVTAVSTLSFRVDPGEVLGLVGPNGAGKTTTLRCIAGILRPSSGHVRIAGHDIETDAVAAKRRLAFVPDEPQLFEYLTVVEHLRFIARLYGVDDAEPHIDELLRELELDTRRNDLPESLSRGMKQKLQVACGLLYSPAALLLDEPLTGLDPGAIRRMRETILARARDGAAIILSSHLLPLVEQLCTRILVIQSGKAVAVGTVAEIVASRPELEGRGLEDVFFALMETSR